MGSLVLRAPFSGELPPPATIPCCRAILAEAWIQPRPGSPPSPRLGQPGVLDIRAETQQSDTSRSLSLLSHWDWWLHARECGEVSRGPATQEWGQK